MSKILSTDEVTERCCRPLTGREVAIDLAASHEALRAECDFLKRREEFFSKALRVADGGQYRNDWPGAVEQCIRDRDEARAERDALAERLALSERIGDGLP